MEMVFLAFHTPKNKKITTLSMRRFFHPSPLVTRLAGCIHNVAAGARWGLWMEEQRVAC